MPRATFEAAFQAVALDRKIVALTRRQSEFVQPIWAYLDGAVAGASRARRRAGARVAGVPRGVERVYGVPRSIVLGIWGMETNFGPFTGSIDTIRALATLAFCAIAAVSSAASSSTALLILERNEVVRDGLVGSWAGAMGQTQFMPSSFLKYAVDGDGDGRRDIWSSVPDALASTANYMRQQGWQPGLPWGFEVVLPEGFDFRHPARSSPIGSASGCAARTGGRCRAPARRPCSCRPARADPPSC